MYCRQTCLISANENQASQDNLVYANSPQVVLIRIERMKTYCAILVLFVKHRFVGSQFYVQSTNLPYCEFKEIHLRIIERISGSKRANCIHGGWPWNTSCHS